MFLMHMRMGREDKDRLENTQVGKGENEGECVQWEIYGNRKRKY